MSEALHTLYSPSSLERRALCPALCPASAKMERDLPEESSQAADRGTQLHALVAKMVLGQGVSDTDIAHFPQDEISTCLAIAERIQAQRATMNNPEALAEFRLKMTYWPDEMGTPDIILVEPFGAAYIADFKFGSSSVTPANRNLQLLALACAVAAEWECSTVKVELIQPAIGEPTSHTYQADELKHYTPTLRGIVEKCESPTPEFNAHPKACQFCRARSMCPELKRSATLPVKVEPMALSISEVGEWLNKLEIVSIFHKALKARAFAILATGGSIPGWKLKETLKDREWREGAADAVAELLRAKGLDTEAAFEPRQLKSPAQIEKLVGKAKAVREAMEQLTHRDAGNPQLVKE
jgi:hypothetical protein